MEQENICYFCSCKPWLSGKKFLCDFWAPRLASRPQLSKYFQIQMPPVHPACPGQPCGLLDPACLHGPALCWFPEFWAQVPHLDFKYLKDFPQYRLILLGKYPSVYTSSWSRLLHLGYRANMAGTLKKSLTRF